MTDYTSIQDKTAIDVVASFSNLILCGIGFAFYNDVRRFLKYFFIGLITGVFTFGIGYVVMSVLAVIKCWKHE